MFGCHTFFLCVFDSHSHPFSRLLPSNYFTLFTSRSHFLTQLRHSFKLSSNATISDLVLIHFGCSQYVSLEVSLPFLIHVATLQFSILPPSFTWKAIAYYNFMFHNISIATSSLIPTASHILKTSNPWTLFLYLLLTLLSTHWTHKLIVGFNSLSMYYCK